MRMYGKETSSKKRDRLPAPHCSEPMTQRQALQNPSPSPNIKNQKNIDNNTKSAYTVLIEQVRILQTVQKEGGEYMEIIISNSSDKPIYEQICMQVKNLIMNGTLSAGEALPSMRALAKDLHISVITVQRAYEDLTRDGFIETVSGKGSFVAAQNKEFIQEEQLRVAEELLQKVAEIGRAHGISYEQMTNILKLFYEE